MEVTATEMEVTATEMEVTATEMEVTATEMGVTAVEMDVVMTGAEMEFLGSGRMTAIVMEKMVMITIRDVEAIDCFQFRGWDSY